MGKLRFFAAIILFSSLATPLVWGQNRRVAILDSANTKHFFGLHYPACSPPASYTLGAEEYQRYFRGWEFVLQTSSIPYDIIFDSGITRGVLDNYDLLILSNTASLSDDQDKAIDKWVRSGGRLLATFGSGYKDVVLDPRELD